MMTSFPGNVALVNHVRDEIADFIQQNPDLAIDLFYLLNNKKEWLSDEPYGGIQRELIVTAVLCAITDRQLSWTGDGRLCLRQR